MSFILQPGFIIPPLTAGGVAYGNGTNAFMTAAGIAGQALVSTGSGAPNWVTSVPSTQAPAGGNTGDLAYQSAPNTTAFLPVVTGGIVYGAATLPAYSAVGTAGDPLLSNGTSAPTFGTLGVANGGTGATSAATARTNLVAQETPVSGTNIKTVGGQSLLGSGNISVGSGTVTTVSGQGTVQGLTLTGSVTTSGFLTLGGSLSAVSLTSQVSGTLPTGNGGTGVTTGPYGVFLFSTSASNTTTINFPGGYTHYVVTGYDFVSSSQSLLLVYFMYSGNQQSANYNNFWVGSSFGTAYTLNFNNENFGRMLQQDSSNGMIFTSSSVGTAFVIEIPNVTGSKSHMYFGQYSGYGGGMNGGAICTAAGTLTGIRFINNSGTISAGTFKLYGIL